MSVVSYLSESGETQWKVYVCARSRLCRSVKTQRRISGIKSEKEAIREEARLFRECEREILEKESKGSTWDAVVNAWDAYLKKDTSRLAKTTQVDYVAAIRNYTLDWKRLQAASITKMLIKELFLKMKSEGCSHGFQKRMKGLLNQVFTFGMEANLIRGMDRSPTFGVQLDRPVEKKSEILTTVQIRLLLQEAKKYDHKWFPIWAMALLTGMRNGELYALQWADIDWEMKAISVSKSYNGRLNITKCTKSGECRTIPISSELMGLLLELKKKTGEKPFLLPRNREWSRGLQAEELRKFCIGVGLPSIRFHALRACFATQLIQNGVPPIMIQKICGWRDLKTMQRYIRLAGVEITGATEVLKVLPSNCDNTTETAERLFGLANAG